MKRKKENGRACSDSTCPGRGRAGLGGEITCLRTEENAAGFHVKAGSGSLPPFPCGDGCDVMCDVVGRREGDPRKNKPNAVALNENNFRMHCVLPTPLSFVSLCWNFPSNCSPVVQFLLGKDYCAGTFFLEENCYSVSRVSEMAVGTTRYCRTTVLYVVHTSVKGLFKCKVDDMHFMIKHFTRHFTESKVAVAEHSALCALPSALCYRGG